MAANPIVHIEIPSGDQTGPEFYKKVFGWEINNQMPEYPMFSAEGGPGGGFTRPGADPPGYKAGELIVYLDVKDIDAKLSEIESNGGKVVHPKTEIPGMGWFAFFTDPNGNRLAVYQGSSAQQ